MTFKGFVGHAICMCLEIVEMFLHSWNIIDPIGSFSFSDWHGLS